MSELKPCFKALEFKEMPFDEDSVTHRYRALMEKHKDSTETDRIARQTLRVNYEMCCAELKKMDGGDAK